MISAWGIDHGEFSKGLKPQHVAALKRVKAAGPFPDGKNNWRQHDYAHDRLALHGVNSGEQVGGTPFKGQLSIVTGHHKKFMNRNTRSTRQRRDKNRKPIFGDAVKS